MDYVCKRFDLGICTIHRDLANFKCRSATAVLSINKIVEPNEEQKVLTSSFDQRFTVTLEDNFLGVFDIADK